PQRPAETGESVARGEAGPAEPMPLALRVLPQKCSRIPPVSIDRKDMNCGSANCRFAAKCGSCPLEVSIPLIHPWMEEPNKLACARIGVRQMTILAPSLRTLPDLPGKLPVHEFERSRGFLLRARRALDC